MTAVADLDRVLSPDGFAFASAPPQDAADPGRFHALFGRDSLIVALQLLPVRPEIAAATLRAHAALLGRAEDPETDEQPGKVVHERWERPPGRLTGRGWPGWRDGELRYYGSADATAWFLVVLAALGDRELAAELEPAWRAAGGWLERALERGGGLVRHGPRRAAGGLAQQGWRDTTDPLDPAAHGGGIVREDGTRPQSPLADADTQAVAYVALRALARLAGEARERPGAAAGRSCAWTAAAAELRGTVARSFGPETMAIEADGREVRGAGSQLGWLLWAGVAPEYAAERLVEPDVRSPWGLRTLSARHPAFDPHAYHRGSIWPFDSWIGWGGLRATGREREAEALRVGVLEAIERLGGAPELYAAGADGPEPIAIANRVQAWTVGARWALEEGWDGRLVA